MDISTSLLQLLVLGSSSNVLESWTKHLFFQVQRVILYLQPDADLEAIDYRKLFHDVCELNWWHFFPGMWRTPASKFVTWPSWKGSCNLRLLLASTMSVHLDKARGFPGDQLPIVTGDCCIESSVTGSEAGASLCFMSRAELECVSPCSWTDIARNSYHQAQVPWNYNNDHDNEVNEVRIYRKKMAKEDPCKGQQFPKRPKELFLIYDQLFCDRGFQPVRSQDCFHRKWRLRQITAVQWVTALRVCDPSPSGRCKTQPEWQIVRLQGVPHRKWKPCGAKSACKFGSHPRWVASFALCSKRSIFFGHGHAKTIALWLTDAHWA